MEPFTWNEERRRWCGYADLGDCRIEVAVYAEADGPEELAAVLTIIPRLEGRIAPACAYAAAQLQPYYNYFNSHVKDAEQVTAEEFAARMRLEGLRLISGEDAWLEFAHDFDDGQRLLKGGLICVRVSPDGSFIHAAWMTQPDAETAREARRCCEPWPPPDEYED